MSLMDSYRNNCLRKKNELSKLLSNRANEMKKVPALTSKIFVAKKRISSSKSISTINSKMKEIERGQNALITIDKKVADISSKIAKKEKEISDEEKKYHQEEVRDNKKRHDSEKKRIQESAKQMKKVEDTLNKQAREQSYLQQTLVDLKNVPERITVLFMASNPNGSEPLRLDEEARAIGEMIRKSEHRDSVRFETRWATRTPDILQAINELNPEVIHFSGHGTDTDELVLQKSDGSPTFVSKEAIVQVMMTFSDKIRLVFFNTCFSYGQAQAVVEHVEAAIGMNKSIGDDAAKIFAAQFYSSIGFGLSVKKAFEQAKAALMLEGILEENTPELYIKNGLDSNQIFIVRP